MATSDDFRREQRGVAIRMAAALSITILISSACLLWGEGAPLALPDRLLVMAKATTLILCWLAAAIGNVARLRFFSADDIAGSASGAATATVSRANALLQNTLEQVALAIPVYAILAILMPSSPQLISALAVLFTIGRLMFWIGYAGGAQARAFGFALTFYPSIGGLVVAIIAVARSSL